MLGGGSDPQPLSMCHRLLSITRSSAARAWHSGGRRGRWEAAFNSISAWEKFPFMWLPVISPGGSAEGGRPAGSRGRYCSQGYPQPLHKANCSTSEPQGAERALLGGVEVRSLASRGY